MTDRLRIIVLGVVVRYPLGGMTWHHLQYVMGLADLGHDVYFLEDSGDYAECYNPEEMTVSTDPDYGLEYTNQTFAKVGLSDHWAYHDAHTARWLGPCADRIGEISASADVVLNLSGVNATRPWWQDVPTRVFVDTDPAFTQVRNLTDPERRALAERHNIFMTFGENITTGGSIIPLDGFPWQSTRQPIVLDAWPVTAGPIAGKLTTVMQWDSYDAIKCDGVRYGMKCDTFWPYVDLPHQTGSNFELAVDRLPAEAKAKLIQHGWQLQHPYEVTSTPWTYQRYLQESKAEFTTAKLGYVISHSGWFSERSAAYLASGRPVVTQETGFSKWLPIGNGLLSFANAMEARSGIEAINRRYIDHCRAARELAEAYFDSRKVLPRLLEGAMNRD